MHMWCGGLVRCGVRAYRPLGYERVYLPLCEVADTPFRIQGEEHVHDTPDPCYNPCRRAVHSNRHIGIKESYSDPI